MAVRERKAEAGGFRGLAALAGEQNWEGLVREVRKSGDENCGLATSVLLAAEGQWDCAKLLARRMGEKVATRVADLAAGSGAWEVVEFVARHCDNCGNAPEHAKTLFRNVSQDYIARLGEGRQWAALGPVARLGGAEAYWLACMEFGKASEKDVEDAFGKNDLRGLSELGCYGREELALYVVRRAFERSGGKGGESGMFKVIHRIYWYHRENGKLYDMGLYSRVKGEAEAALGRMKERNPRLQWHPDKKDSRQGRKPFDEFDDHLVEGYFRV